MDLRDKLGREHDKTTAEQDNFLSLQEIESISDRNTIKKNKPSMNLLKRMV